MNMPTTIRIAITTNDLVQVNASFASAQQIVIYEVSGEEAEFVDCVQFRGGGGGKGRGKKDGHCWMAEAEADSATRDRDQAKLEALSGCAMLFSLGLGDVHALTVKSKGIYPVKMERPREIPQVIAYVQKMINNENPPLWMRRALMGKRGEPDYSDQYA